MHQSCCYEVSKVVCLEVEAVAERPVLGGTHLCSHHGVVYLLLSGFLTCVLLQLGKAFVQFRYDYRCMYISVLALRLYDAANEPVHYLFQFRVLVYGIHRGNCLKPFVHVAVVEWGTVTASAFFACGNEKIVKTMRFVRLPCFPHALYGRAAEHSEALAPETVGPFHGVDRGGCQYGILALACVRNAVLLCHGRHCRHYGKCHAESCFFHAILFFYIIVLFVSFFCNRRIRIFNVRCFLWLNIIYYIQLYGGRKALQHFLINKRVLFV